MESNILGYMLSYFIVKYSTFSFVFEEVHKQIKDDKENLRVGYRLFKIIKIKLIIFYILDFFLLGVCIYYVTIFCTIYHSSQINWLIDCFSGIGISLLVSVGMSLIIAIFRFIGIKMNSKNIYNVSKYLND